MYRETWIEVDKKAIEKNIQQLTEPLGSSRWMAIVKANAYGHGSVEMAKVAVEKGCAMLGVATLDEALSLRNAGMNHPILVLGRVHAKHANVAAKHNISLCAFQKEWLQEAYENLEKQSLLSIHVKIDTGMNRLGLKWDEKEEIKAFIEDLFTYEAIQTEGIFTHFATSDETENEFVMTQYQRFLHVLSLFHEKKVTFAWVHCANSAFSMRFPKEVFNLARLGISMYGLQPSKEVKEETELPLCSAFSLYSEISHVKQIKKGETVGYGQTFTATNDTYVATLPIGYADGIPRSYSKREGKVCINGKRYPMIGSICMDQLMIEVDETIHIGDRVQLIGNEISVDEVAQKNNTINYEVVCMFTSRVPILYV